MTDDKERADQIRKDIEKSLENYQRIKTPRRVFCITGPSASGKTYLRRQFRNYLSVSTDDYYWGKSRLTPDENGEYDFDSPESADLNLAGKVIYTLATAKPQTAILTPVYNMKTSERDDMRNVIVPGEDVKIVVEGIFAFNIPLIEELVVMRIFVDAPEEIRIARRIRRDKTERGRDTMSVLKQWEKVDKGYHAHIKHQKAYADLVIDGGILQ